MLDNIKALLGKGDVDGALKLVLSLKDRMLKMELLTYMIQELGEDYVEYPILLSESLATIASLAEDRDKVKALALLSYALASAGDEKKAEKFIKEALSVAKKIYYPIWKAEALAYVAYYLGLIGDTKSAFYYFNIALETLEKSNEVYSAVLPVMSLIADLSLEVGDSLETEEAIDFYSLSRQIYTSMKKFVSASQVEEKIHMVKEAFKEGSLAVKRALEKGDIDRAIAIVKYLSPEEKVAALLDISYWLFLHEREDLARTLLSDVFDIMLIKKIKPNDLELFVVAYKFIKIGLLDEALTVAGVIEDVDEASKILSEIALAYARFGNENKALSIAEAIQNEAIKKKLLKRLGGEDVGYE